MTTRAADEEDEMVIARDCAQTIDRGRIGSGVARRTSA
jgi:hypothetical protein